MNLYTKLSPELRRIAAEGMRAWQSGLPLEQVLADSALLGYRISRGDRPHASYTAVRPAAAPNGGQDELVSAIETAMADEATAVPFYGELMNLAEDEMAKDYIRHAMEDEQKHYELLGQLYQRLTGSTFTAQPAKVEYEDLADGLKKAMDDEYEAMEFYRDLYLRYPEEQIRRVFFELMTDELEHATRFNYVLQTL